MVIYNKKIDEFILDIIEDSIKNTIETELKKIPEFEFIEIDGCILNKNNINKKINVKRMLQIYGDKTGIEASNSEFRINDFIDIKDTKSKYLLSRFIMKKWKESLKNKFPNYNFFIYLSIDQEDFTIRFHKKRLDEMMWVDNNIDDFKEMLLIYEF